MKKKMLFALSFLIILGSSCSSWCVNVPTIRSIELLDANGKLLSKIDGWIILQPDSIIKVDFEGDATHIDFYTAPTGTETLLEQKMIGIIDIKKGDKTGQLKWEVPDNFLGYIWVLIYNGDIARTSDTDNFFIKAILEE